MACLDHGGENCTFDVVIAGIGNLMDCVFESCVQSIDKI
jgi:hypothetical protein